jgi:hypothetical protein
MGTRVPLAPRSFRLRVDEHASGPPAVWLHPDGSSQEGRIRSTTRSAERGSIWLAGELDRRGKQTGAAPD